jgi:hypothetical protein
MALACLAPGAPTLAGEPAVKLQVEINACNYSGDTSGIPDDTLTVIHRSSGGALKAKRTFDVSGAGFSVGCPGPRVRTGDRLELRTGAAKTLLRTFIVPALTIATARAFDRVSGKAPGVTSVTVQVVICDVAFFGCTGSIEEAVSVNPSTRKWTFTSPDEVKGGAYATVTWAKGGDKVSRTQRFAQLLVRPGSAMVVGVGRTSGIKEVVSLRRGDRLGSANPRTTASATFSATIKRSGTPMKVKTGDVLSSTIAGDATVTVFPTSLSQGVGGLEGTCRKNGAVTVMIRSAEGEVLFGYTPDVGTDGGWELDVALPVGGSVEAFCATKAGDAIVRRITVS